MVGYGWNENAYIILDAKVVRRRVEGFHFHVDSHRIGGHRSVAI